MRTALLLLAGAALGYYAARLVAEMEDGDWSVVPPDVPVGGGVAALPVLLTVSELRRVMSGKVD